ncbi:MAG: 30S ribosomal protein S4 [Thermodesulfobacteriota bacterium]|nr:30S ribosomal protein S4 [Thermodesulfobacteriota bacterium]
MARYTKSQCRICRRENAKLFLKGDRCYSDKCSFDRRSYAPGHHGKRRTKYSDYGLQLREKQKVKRIYGVLEKQFRRYFEKADQMRGITGENLLILLERRLDNIIYRLGFAQTRNQARQLVNHGHFLVNNRKIDLPSYLVKIGENIELKERSRKIPNITEAIETVERRGIPSWMELDKNNFQGRVLNYPQRTDLIMPIQEQLVVELYSK